VFRLGELEGHILQDCGGLTAGPAGFLSGQTGADDKLDDGLRLAAGRGVTIPAAPLRRLIRRI